MSHQCPANLGSSDFENALSCSCLHPHLDPAVVLYSAAHLSYPAPVSWMAVWEKERGLKDTPSDKGAKQSRGKGWPGLCFSVPAPPAPSILRSKVTSQI
jgi:hypothetical protein